MKPSNRSSLGSTILRPFTAAFPPITPSGMPLFFNVPPRHIALIQLAGYSTATHYLHATLYRETLFLALSRVYHKCDILNEQAPEALIKVAMSRRGKPRPF